MIETSNGCTRFRHTELPGTNPPLTGPRRKQDSRAQSMVEFAMTLPILLMLILGIIEFGRMLFTYSAVISAAREAARYGAAGGEARPGVAYYRDCDGIREAAMRIGKFAGIQNDETGIAIQYDDDPFDDVGANSGTLKPTVCLVGQLGPTLQPEDRIIVTVTARFTPLQGIVPLPGFNITSVVRRTVIIGVNLE